MLFKQQEPKANLFNPNLKDSVNQETWFHFSKVKENN